jgi:hypothetical protein
LNTHTLPGYALGTFKRAGQPLQLINAYEESVRPKSGLLAESIGVLALTDGRAIDSDVLGFASGRGEPK